MSTTAVFLCCICKIKRKCLETMTTPELFPQSQASNDQHDILTSCRQSSYCCRSLSTARSCSRTWNKEKKTYFGYNLSKLQLNTLLCMKICYFINGIIATILIKSLGKFANIWLFCSPPPFPPPEQCWCWFMLSIPALYSNIALGEGGGELGNWMSSHFKIICHQLPFFQVSQGLLARIVALHPKVNSIAVNPTVDFTADPKVEHEQPSTWTWWWIS